MYWQWKLETGVNQDEINANDLLDSQWINDEILLEIETIGRQISDNSIKQYDVTFDLNGGNLANYDGAEQVTKKVSYGDVYGELPVPTREGYRFVGWNGKNMFNINSASVWGGNSYINGEKVYLDTSNVTGNVGTSLKIQKYLNSQYVAEFIGDYKKTDEKRSFSVNKDKSFNQLLIRINTNIVDPYLLMPKLNMIDGKKYTLTYRASNLDIQNCKAILSEIQLEEGDIATEYEPYYVSKTTKITQNKNHRLTAIWEKDGGNIFSLR